MRHPFCVDQRIVTVTVLVTRRHRFAVETATRIGVSWLKLAFLFGIRTGLHVTRRRCSSARLLVIGVTPGGEGGYARPRRIEAVPGGNHAATGRESGIAPRV